jgi:hypothetical protein
MDKGEHSFPFEHVADLSDEEITEFVESSIWISAIYFWGEDFRNAAKIVENKDIYTTITAPDGENTLSLSFFLDQELDEDAYPGDDEGGIVSVTARMEVYRDDMTGILPKKMRGYMFWEVTDYTFPVDEDEPTVEHYYLLRDKRGNEAELDSSQEELREKIEEEFDTEYRTSSPTSQDCIDIQNILLTLNVPEEFIRPPQ